MCKNNKFLIRFKYNYFYSSPVPLMLRSRCFRDEFVTKLSKSEEGVNFGRQLFGFEKSRDTLHLNKFYLKTSVNRGPTGF